LGSLRDAASRAAIGVRLRRALARAATARPLRYLAHPAYETIVRTELLAIRGFEPRVPPRCDVSDLTAIIKTFERPYALRRLLTSLWDAHPRLKVVIADDSRQPVRIADERVTIVRLPYDSGVAEGRNRALAEVRTPFILQLDDDLVWTRRSGLGRVLASMRGHAELDIVGGQWFTLPAFRKDVRDGSRRTFGGFAGRPESVAGLPVHDRVANFFVGRTASVAAIGWDPRLKRLEHSDFFQRAMGKLLVAFDDRFVCFHARTPFDEAYMERRTDFAEDMAYLERKWEAVWKSRAEPTSRGRADGIDGPADVAQGRKDGAKLESRCR
jgi:glycosyltransferase involved in cell wall biosynthesis